MSAFMIDHVTWTYYKKQVKSHYLGQSYYKIPQILRPVAHQDYLHRILLLSTYLAKYPVLVLF